VIYLMTLTESRTLICSIMWWEDRTVAGRVTGQFDLVVKRKARMLGVTAEVRSLYLLSPRQQCHCLSPLSCPYGYRCRKCLVFSRLALIYSFDADACKRV